MQVFKLFFKIARSKIGISLLFLGVFMAICFPMTKATRDQSNFEETSLSLYIRDEDHSEASRRLVENLTAKNEIVELPHDSQKILDAMYYEIVDYALVIREGFVEPSVAGAVAFDTFQFLRNGYFCVDCKDSTPEKLVFNRVCSMKSSYKPA